MPVFSDWTMIDPALETLLKTQPTLWRGGDQHPANQQTIKTGFSNLDNALPGGGWSSGTLAEFFVEHNGIGELSLLLPVLKSMTQQRQWTALVHPPYIPYAPALVNAGIELDRVLVVDTDNDKDTLWSAEQLLRAGLFTTVICWVHKTTSRHQRRLQLAAETGHSWAVTYRPASAASENSPAALRIALSMKQERPGHRLAVNIVKSRGGETCDVVINTQDFDSSQGVEWPGFDLVRPGAAQPGAARPNAARPDFTQSNSCYPAD